MIGAFVPFTGTISSAGTSTTFDVGGMHGKYILVIPSMACGTGMGIRVSDSLTGTYRNLYHTPTVATTAPVLFVLASGITNCAVEIPNPGRYFQVYINTATSDTAYTYKVLCGET